MPAKTVAGKISFSPALTRPVPKWFEPLSLPSVSVKASWRSLQQRRLMHAYALISNPSHFEESIASIGAKTGFSKSTAFSRAFRELYKMTPSDVREAAKSGFQMAPNPAEPGEASFNMLNRWLLGLDANGP